MFISISLKVKNIRKRLKIVIEHVIDMFDEKIWIEQIIYYY